MNVLSIAPYFGAKATIVKEIVAEMNQECTCFYDLFGGMGSITLNNVGYQEQFYNDYNSAIAHLVYVLSKRGEELVYSMFEAEYSEEAFNNAKELIEMSELTRQNTVNKNKEITQEDMKIARATWVILLQSYRGLMKEFKGIHKGNEQVKYHRNIMKKHKIPQCLEEVVVMNRDAFDILVEIKDKEEVMIYLDPPYTHKQRTSKKAYKHELEDKDQWRLVSLIQDAKAKILLSGYQNDIYNSVLTEERGWVSYPIKEVYKRSSMTRGKPQPKVLEYIWKNY